MEPKQTSVKVQIVPKEQTDFIKQINELCDKNLINYEKIIELCDVATKLDAIKSPGYSAQLLQFALEHWC